MPKYFKCLATVSCDLSLITIPVSNCLWFYDINISQCSVAMRLMCGFSYLFTANLSLSLTMKDFWKSFFQDITKLPPWVWWLTFLEHKFLYRVFRFDGTR